MTKLLQSPLFRYVRTNWIESIRIYWVPLVASSIATIVGVFMTTSHRADTFWIAYTFLTCILATIIFGGIAVLNQDRIHQSAMHTFGRYALGSIPLIYFVSVVTRYTELGAGVGITFALLAASSIFFLLCSAELRRDSTATTMWQFGVRSISSAAIATAVGVIGYIATSLAAVSIEHLFQVPMTDRVYATIAVIMFTFVVPTIVVVSIAHVRAASRNTNASFSPLVLRLVQFVFTPILIAYFLILYAYALKIVFQWELPQESVVLPVLIYTIVGVCTYALVDPWRRNNTHRLFHWLQLGILLSFIPLLILFGIAIGDRVRAYGMTEPRYLATLFGVWLFSISIAFIRNRNFSLRIIPLSLSAVFLIASLPGIGAVATTVRSQQSQLITLLQQEKILVDGAIAPTHSTSTTPEISMRVSDLLYTLNSRNGIVALASQVGLPETTPANAILHAIQSPIGWGQNPVLPVVEYVQDSREMTVTGYDELLEVSSWPSPTFFATTTIRFSADGTTLIVEPKHKQSLRIPLTQFPTETAPTYDAENNDLRVRVIPTYFAVEKNTNGEVTAIHQLHVRVLIDYKDTH